MEFDTIEDAGREAATGDYDCGYFALCTNAAQGVVDAGPVGIVAACKRCADRVGAVLITGQVDA